VTNVFVIPVQVPISSSTNDENIERVRNFARYDRLKIIQEVCLQYSSHWFEDALL
jgi:hypothetical protein